MDKLKNVFAAFNQELSQFGEIVIGGGSVRDALMGKSPKDYDIFILGHTELTEEIKERIINRLSKYPKVEVEFEWHKSEPFFIISIHYENSEVQFMYHPAKTIEELVDTFDWNVSMYAFGKGGVYSPEGVSIDQIKKGGLLFLNPKLETFKFPYSSLRRGYRFSERYGMRLPSTEVDKLACDITNKLIIQARNHKISEKQKRAAKKASDEKTEE